MFRIPTSSRNIFLHSKTCRISLGPIQPPIQWNRGSFPGIMWPERDVDPTPPSAEVASEWSSSFVSPSTPCTVTSLLLSLIIIIHSDISVVTALAKQVFCSDCQFDTKHGSRTVLVTSCKTL